MPNARFHVTRLAAICLVAFGGSVSYSAGEPSATERALANIDANLLGDRSDSEARERLAGMLSRDVRARRRAANLADVRAWRAIGDKEAWEQLRDERIARLRASLGTYPDPPADLDVHVTRTIDGDGFAIRCLVFESRPGVRVTAHLYVPDDTDAPHPGILICHSHHRPKEQGELQDMGMTWARAGCHVLVMDQLGHGERRAHPFAAASDFDGEFRVSRQDYYFRYNTGLQLHLTGDSLLGWMAWDLMRGVDLLLDQPGVDAKRIALLGAVAGGGDPAGVAAALDSRIAAVVPFNFGGPQPETVFPLPDDAEVAFNYFGGGSWESTRNLRGSIADEFPHWTIVASVAPRRLIHAHEFAWDRDRDPVWRRYERIWGEWYGRREHLGAVHGRGSVRGRPPESTHCTNIGRSHREGIHPRFREWFGIEVEEFSNRRAESELHVLRGTDLNVPPLHGVAGRLAEDRRDAFVATLPKGRGERRAALQKAWAEVLGPVEAMSRPVVTRVDTDVADRRGVEVRRFVLRVEREIDVPVVHLVAPGEHGRPCVVMLAQRGKAAILEHRRAVVTALLDAGCDVCLPDLRGTGETRPGDGRGRRSADTALASTEQMLGGTSVGSRLRDVRTLLAVLRRDDRFNGRFAVWADSFAKPNPSGANVRVPMGASVEPRIAEPLGHIVALLTGLFEEDVVAIVSARGGLTSFRSALDSEFVHLPYDVIVPGAIPVGDLEVLAESLAPGTLHASGRVNARNRRVDSAADLEVLATDLAVRLQGEQER